MALLASWRFIFFPSVLMFLTFPCVLGSGNHGEDVKEAFFYLDSTPTHSYMKMNYKYPHAAFPYKTLVDENQRRTRRDPEFELWEAEARRTRQSNSEIPLRIRHPGPNLTRMGICPVRCVTHVPGSYPGCLSRKSDRSLIVADGDDVIG